MDFVQISVGLGLVAGAVQLAGYWFYVRCTRRINTGSWLLWAFLGVVDLVSYAAVTHGDWVVNLLPAACATAAVGTFGWAVLRKRLSSPDVVDWLFIGAGVAIMAVWYFTDAVFANLLFVANGALSFIPLCRGQLTRRDEEEELLPWLLWTLAYALLTATVVFRFERWEELAYPAAHLGLHALVALIVLKIQRPSR